MGETEHEWLNIFVYFGIVHTCDLTVILTHESSTKTFIKIALFVPPIH